MKHAFNREWLIKKFEEIRRRILNAISQLDDEQLNWRPHESSHSISTLIRHIEGNIKERILKGILHQEIHRNREEELTHVFVEKSELEKICAERLQFVIDTIRNISDETLEQKQIVRSRERTNLDMLHQCAAHFSEHMGQIFYIAKQCLKEDYKSTSL
ncbi:DinB family protein [Paenibacillus xylanilyticus]|uniref:DinB family protein n=1 Tax=Paenibacillus xylanilyticus TaxID=248903 RepID=UPI00129D9DDF|nr:DinB family protein [Paenibacillus xylanilyticus]